MIVKTKEVRPMREFMIFLQKRMETPKQFGTLHLVAIALLVVINFCECFFFRNSSERKYRGILVIIWVLMFVTEVLAEIVLSLTITEGEVFVWKYRCSFIPLQLCDAPLYLLLPIAFLKDGKLRDALSSYMCSYVLVGGLSVFIFSSTILGSNVFLNFRTLLHHGLQVAVGIFIGVRNRKRLSLRTFLSTGLVFLFAVACVTLFNVVGHALFPDEYINMFYISPYYRRTVPFWNDAWQSMHPVEVILFYIVVMSALAFAFYFVYRLFVRLFSPSSKEEKG